MAKPIAGEKENDFRQIGKIRKKRDANVEVELRYTNFRKKKDEKNNKKLEGFN